MVFEALRRFLRSLCTGPPRPSMAFDVNLWLTEAPQHSLAAQPSVDPTHTPACDDELMVMLCCNGRDHPGRNKDDDMLLRG